ncbi:hypothetical protein MIND_00748600 [Mycena indigotica]|uniref:Uncharacterized protein n=1 Tax=Mycena indigotica TaxID=2126181 RepID=A0A8H6SLI4_9AGAR|nr:uncharacterized protein MIND_00748600 [Mycena indigotica]KAF7301828.1 hypothetical protein MIND_00748600 [Mycena indigotica]
MQEPLRAEDGWAIEWFTKFRTTHPVVEEGGIRSISLRSWRNEPILERPEYPSIASYVFEELERKATANSRATQGGLIISGKSVGLSYLLALAIHWRIFTTWHCEADTAIVFDPAVSESELFTIRASELAFCHFPRVHLVLSDSGPGNPHPPPTFMNEANCALIVQATSTVFERATYSWAKRKIAMLWPMDLWTEMEFSSLQELRELAGEVPTEDPGEFYTPLQLFRLLGPAVRLPFQNRIRNSGDIHADLGHLVPSPNIQSIRNLTSRIVDPTIIQQEFDSFVFALPPRFHGRHKLRWPLGFQPQYFVPTKFLARQFVRELEKCALEEQYERVAQFFHMPQVAGVLYEALMPNFLSLGNSPFEAKFHRSSLTFSLPSRLPIHPAPFHPSSGVLPNPNQLTIPHQSYASFDALTASKVGNKMQVTLFQAAIARAHKIWGQDIRLLIELYQKHHVDVEVLFVFVVPSDSAGVAVSRPFWEKGITLGVGGQDFHIPVGWGAIELPNMFTTSLRRLDEMQEYPFLLLTHGEEEGGTFAEAQLVDEEVLPEVTEQLCDSQTNQHRSLHKRKQTQARDDKQESDQEQNITRSRNEVPAGKRQRTLK